jgi:hypothetical protein
MLYAEIDQHLEGEATAAGRGRERQSPQRLQQEDGHHGHQPGGAGITAAWRRNWEQVILFLAYPPEVRRMIYPHPNSPYVERGPECYCHEDASGCSS